LNRAKELCLERSSLLGERADRLYEWFERSLALPGDVAECGVYRGETARELARFLRMCGAPKTVHLFDSCKGLPNLVTEEEREASVWKDLGHGQYASSVEEVEATIRGLPCRLHVGMFSETLPRFCEPLCFIHSDGDLYQSTVEVIEFASRLLVPGGIIVFDDYGNPRLPGVKMAVERHLDRNRFAVFPSHDTIQCFAIRNEGLPK